MTRRVVAAAPGKLFVAGEYAVVEPGYPAVLIGVERRVTLTMTEAATQRPIEQGRYVAAVIDVMTALAAARGALAGAVPFAMSTRSDLKDAATSRRAARKYGLGSSGAVTVAATRALDAWYGLGLSLPEQARAAMLATWRVNPRASCGDVAASLLGGWVAFASPDRAWVAANDAEIPTPDSVAALVDAEWPGLSARSLPVPTSFGVRIGWTGAPASTTDLVAAVRAAGVPEEFLGGSRGVVVDLIEAIERDDVAGAQHAVRAARALLRGLGDGAGVAIETPQLTALVDVAERHGLAAKSSGAGGGDCGIGIGRVSDAAGLGREWEAVGVVPLRAGVAGPASVEVTGE